MKSFTTKTAFWQGVGDGAPFVLVAGPFAALFGVLSAEAGLSIVETMTFSLAVIAGAAQFTALQLMVEDAPTVIALLSGLAVNLRMAMYSASLTPYLGAAPFWQRAFAAYLLVDQAYALSHSKFERKPEMTVPLRMAYYFGSCFFVMIAWFAGSYLGAAAGTQLPETLPLEMAMPIAFLSLIGPMLRTMAHVIAALVAILVSLVAAGIPYSLGLLVAGAAGMMAGAQAELWLERIALYRKQENAASPSGRTRFWLRSETDKTQARQRPSQGPT